MNGNMFIRSLLYLPLLGWGSLSWAGFQKSEWTLASSELKYHVNFLLKSFDGISREAKGKGRCREGQCEFLIAVPVKTFESGDGNRDAHMRETTKAALFPMVQVRLTITEPRKAGVINTGVNVEFSGKTHNYPDLDLHVSEKGDGVVVRGKIPMELSHFGLERPSLLNMRIDDEVPVEFITEWQ